MTSSFFPTSLRETLGEKRRDKSFGDKQQNMLAKPAGGYSPHRRQPGGGAGTTAVVSEANSLRVRADVLLAAIEKLSTTIDLSTQLPISEQMHDKCVTELHATELQARNLLPVVEGSLAALGPQAAASIMATIHNLADNCSSVISTVTGLVQALRSDRQLFKDLAKTRGELCDVLKKRCELAEQESIRIVSLCDSRQENLQSATSYVKLLMAERIAWREQFGLNPAKLKLAEPSINSFVEKCRTALTLLTASSTDATGGEAALGGLRAVGHDSHSTASAVSAPPGATSFLRIHDNVERATARLENKVRATVTSTFTPRYVSSAEELAMLSDALKNSGTDVALYQELEQREKILHDQRTGLVKKAQLLREQLSHFRTVLKKTRDTASQMSMQDDFRKINYQMAITVGKISYMEEQQRAKLQLAQSSSSVYDSESAAAGGAPRSTFGSSASLTYGGTNSSFRGNTNNAIRIVRKQSGAVSPALDNSFRSKSPNAVTGGMGGFSLDSPRSATIAGTSSGAFLFPSSRNSSIAGEIVASPIPLGADASSGTMSQRGSLAFAASDTYSTPTDISPSSQAVVPPPQRTSLLLGDETMSPPSLSPTPRSRQSVVVFKFDKGPRDEMEQAGDGTPLPSPQGSKAAVSAGAEPLRVSVSEAPASSSVQQQRVYEEHHVPTVVTTTASKRHSRAGSTASFVAVAATATPKKKRHVPEWMDGGGVAEEEEVVLEQRKPPPIDLDPLFSNVQFLVPDKPKSVEKRMSIHRRISVKVEQALDRAQALEHESRRLSLSATATMETTTLGSGSSTVHYNDGFQSIESSRRNSSAVGGFGMLPSSARRRTSTSASRRDSLLDDETDVQHEELSGSRTRGQRRSTTFSAGIYGVSRLGSSK